LRQKIGVVYGNPETTTGGNALKFYASVRLDIRKTGVVKNGEQAIGNKTRVKAVKKKVAPRDHASWRTTTANATPSGKSTCFAWTPGRRPRNHRHAHADPTVDHHA
jgi:RecA/RadA recombinase